MIKSLTQKQINFTQDYFNEIPSFQAYMNHYNVKSRAVADVCASQALRNPKIQAYLQKLRDKMEDEAIAGPKERRKILSEIARASIPDYLTESGVQVNKQSPNVRAVAEIETRSRMGKQGAINITKFKLHNPVPAIDLLNKMDRMYSEGGNTYNDIKVLIVREKPKEIEGGSNNGSNRGGQEELPEGLHEA